MSQIRNFFKIKKPLSKEERKVADFKTIKNDPSGFKNTLADLPGNTLLRCHVRVTKDEEGKKIGSGFIYQAHHKKLKQKQTAHSKSHTEKLKGVLLRVVPQTGKHIQARIDEIPSAQRGGIYAADVRDFLTKAENGFSLYDHLLVPKNKKALLSLVKEQNETSNAFWRGFLSDKQFSEQIREHFLLGDFENLKEEFTQKLQNFLGVRGEEGIYTCIFKEFLYELSPAQAIGENLYTKNPQTTWQKIGQNDTGGFGEVRFYEDENSGKKIAVKVEKNLEMGRLQKEENNRGEFQKEFKIAKKLEENGATHCVKALFPLVLEDGRFGYAMEFCPNGDLRERSHKIAADLKTTLQNNPENAENYERKAFLVRLLLAQDITNGLWEMQTAGIIHRDFKPQNCMITEKGVAKLTDFGSAQEGETFDVRGISPVDNPLWAAPEMLAANKRKEISKKDKNLKFPEEKFISGKKIDNWSLGVSIFELFQDVLVASGGYRQSSFYTKQASKVLIKHTLEHDEIKHDIVKLVPPDDILYELKQNTDFLYQDTESSKKLGEGNVAKALQESGRSFSLIRDFQENAPRDLKTLITHYVTQNEENDLPAVGENGFFTKETTGSHILDEIVNRLLRPNPEERLAVEDVLLGIAQIFEAPDRNYTDEEISWARAYLRGEVSFQDGFDEDERFLSRNSQIFIEDFSVPLPNGDMKKLI